MAGVEDLTEQDWLDALIEATEKRDAPDGPYWFTTTQYAKRWNTNNPDKKPISSDTALGWLKQAVMDGTAEAWEGNRKGREGYYRLKA